MRERRMPIIPNGYAAQQTAADCIAEADCKKQQTVSTTSTTAAAAVVYDATMTITAGGGGGLPSPAFSAASSTIPTSSTRLLVRRATQPATTATTTRFLRIQRIRYPDVENVVVVATSTKTTATSGRPSLIGAYNQDQEGQPAGGLT